MTVAPSPEWIDALAVAARTAEGGTSVPADVDLVIQQVVTGPDGPDTRWAVRIQDGRIEVTAGDAPDAHVTFRQDHATAGAIASGELSAQAAFMEGRVRVGGDIRRLLDTHLDIGELPDVFAAARTVHPGGADGAPA